MALPKTRDLLRSYISDLNVGDVFSVEDVIMWFKATWPKWTPSSNGIGSFIRGFENVRILKTGVYKVIA